MFIVGDDDLVGVYCVDFGFDVCYYLLFLLLFIVFVVVIDFDGECYWMW